MKLIDFRQNKTSELVHKESMINKELYMMMQKINSWAPRRSGWTKLWLGSSLLEENLQNQLGGKVTRRCGVSQIASNA